MMKSFFKHHLDRCKKGALTNGILHCHAKGVVSVMFHDQPENRVRMFFTLPEHELHLNLPLSDKMTVAIHTHHCDVRLVRLFGQTFNHVYGVTPQIDGPVHECLYSSAVNGGKGGIERTGNMFDAYALERNFMDDCSMHASELHTVSVPEGKSAAWLVFEGTEWLDYKPICYTMNPHFDPTGMYQPMSREQILNVLETTLLNL